MVPLEKSWYQELRTGYTVGEGRMLVPEKHAYQSLGIDLRPPGSLTCSAVGSRLPTMS